MEFSSIWFFSISSLVSLVFLTTGIYCLDEAIIATLHRDWFMHQIQAWIASSVLLSISYAFLFRPPLEHQELNADGGAARKLIVFYGFFHPELIKSLLFPFLSVYNYFRFPNTINLILPVISLIPIVYFFYWTLKYFNKTHGNGNLLVGNVCPFGLGVFGTAQQLLHTVCLWLGCDTIHRKPENTSEVTL